MNTLWIIVGLLLVILVIVVFYRKFKQLQHMEAVENSEHMIILNDRTFSQNIKKGISIVDFWAPWCMPCKIIAPIMNELADEFEANVKVCKLNVDENRQTSEKLNIRNIPTVMIFKDGKIAEQFVGVKPKTFYSKALKKLL